jgi:hypothetical protein
MLNFTPDMKLAILTRARSKQGVRVQFWENLVKAFYLSNPL